MKGVSWFLPARSDTQGTLSAFRLWQKCLYESDSTGGGISPAFPGHFDWIWEGGGISRVNIGDGATLRPQQCLPNH